MGFNIPYSAGVDWCDEEFNINSTKCKHNVGGLCLVYIHLDDAFDCCPEYCPRIRIAKDKLAEKGGYIELEVGDSIYTK